MPKPSEKEPTLAKTPGIVEYKLQTEASVVTLRIEKFSLELLRKVEDVLDVLAILEEKAANSLPQEQRLFLAKGTTRSTELIKPYAALIVQGKVVEDKMILDRDGYFTGYNVTSKAPDGHLDIRLLRFLANGAVIQLFAEKGRFPWLQNLKGNVSIVCSDKVSPEEAKKHLEAFAHAPY